MTETITDLLAAYRAGTMRPSDILSRTYQRIRAHDDPAVFITLRDEADAMAEARRLEAEGPRGRSLYGIPVAIKDNIDAAGLPTTAACPAFEYQPDRDSTAVARLRQAGAIVVGKTNLDQFATGLVGVRSPYGIPRNAINPALVPGGSSSGSAVAVSAGLVPLALGTDTAGSGRVPAGLGNIVGLKPSLGLISTFGVVPACRSLDCVSIFALTADDAWAALCAIAGPDANDAYSRTAPLGAPAAFRKGVRIGVPIPGQRIFFGNEAFSAAYDEAIARTAALGAEIAEIDIEPFYETARLLYDGPWVAERYIVLKSLLASDPMAVHPVTKEITVQGARPSAVDTFEALYKLEELRRVKDHVFRGIEALLLPTAPTAYTVAQLQADPILLNSRLGTYTNFVNLLDLCGLAVPAAMTAGDIPFGVTLLAPSGQDALLACIGRAFHADTGLPLGALGVAQPPLAALPASLAPGEIAIAVVGAHLSGMPLNGELTAERARLVGTATTSADYRLYALNGGGVRKPGLLRVAPGQGAAIEIEVWAMPAEGFGRFVGSLSQPMSIGTLTLSDGRAVKGFLVEPQAVEGAQDITGFGGWRAYLAQAKR